MDPYELFSTPPGEIMLSSTPTKEVSKGKTSKAPNSGRKAYSARKAAKEPSKHVLQNRSKTTENYHTPINKNTRINRQRKKKQENNLWDKCLKTNPELAQFVDNFNQSLEEALSKPLEMSDDK